jgi:hypothetical protein
MTVKQDRHEQWLAAAADLQGMPGMPRHTLRPTDASILYVRFNQLCD